MPSEDEIEEYAIGGRTKDVSYIGSLYCPTIKPDTSKFAQKFEDELARRITELQDEKDDLPFSGCNYIIRLPKEVEDEYRKQIHELCQSDNTHALMSGIFYLQQLKETQDDTDVSREPRTEPDPTAEAGQ